jgi:hypothetical protein
MVNSTQILFGIDSLVSESPQVAPKMKGSYLRACFGFAGILVSCLIAYQSYLYVNDSSIAEECKSSLLTKNKSRKGATYFDMEDGSTTLSSSAFGFRFTKNWSEDFDDKPYQKLY